MRLKTKQNSCNILIQRLPFFYIQVLHVSVFVQSDGNLAATLRVPSQQDAQYAISQLHRKKIGAKRIIISYVNQNQPSPELKRYDTCNTN